MARIRREKQPPLLSTEPTAPPRWAILILFVVFGLGVDVASLPASAFAEGRITQSGFDGTQSEIVASSVARFRRAALQLPSLHIRHSASGGGECAVRGRTVNTWPVIYVTICAVEEEVIVHELAHAWAFTHLDRADEVAWNERRGVPTWLSRQEPWDQRGSEHVADILTWYLYWSDFAVSQRRIGGEGAASRYLSDVEWLLQNGGAVPGLGVFAARSSLISLAFPATR